MKEYKFQYNKPKETLLVVSLCIAILILSEALGIYFKLNAFLGIVISFGLTFLLFQKLKSKAVNICTAKLTETDLIFEFENATRVLNFADLISYKAYYGKNGVVLYLKNKIDNFKISVNNNYCKTEDFELFCKDTIIQLDKYKTKNNSGIVHEGSIFATKAMLYFLIVGTAIYLAAFFIETKALRIAIGVSGGLYFFIMWTTYFTRSKIKSK